MSYLNGARKSIRITHYFFIISVNGNVIEQRMHMIPQEQICQWVEHFRTRSGVEIVKLRKDWHTYNPSIQGIWTPFTNKDTELNVTQFPNTEHSKCPVLEVSATERLMELAKQLRAQGNVVEIPEDASSRAVTET